MARKVMGVEGYYPHPAVDALRPETPQFLVT
jgi:hypothetical protein